MKTELIMKRLPVGQLKPAKYNPRKDLKPGYPAYEKIKRSLHDFGYVDPIVWNEVTGNIVGGHQRYKVLVNEGATDVHYETLDNLLEGYRLCCMVRCGTAASGSDGLGDGHALL